MFIRFAPLFALCAPASDMPAPTAAGSPLPAAAPAAVETTPSPAPAPDPAPAAAKGGVIDGAIAMFRDKGAMVAELSSLRAANGTLTAELATMRTQLASVTADRDNLQAGFTRLQTALDTAQKEKTDLSTEVTHQLATVGVAEAKLPVGGGNPAQTGGSLDDQINELNKRIEASTDSKEKGRLGNEVWDLMMKRGGAVTVKVN